MNSITGLLRKRVAELERTVEAVLKVGSNEMSELLDRWDQTEPAIQRAIVTRMAGRIIELQQQVEDLKT